MSDILKRLGYVSEADLAELLGITVLALRNRPRTRLPPFVKDGRRKLFKETDVRDYLERRTINSEVVQ
jgi:hypothetical protein